MPSTVMLVNIDPVTVFDDNMQVQCLPVFGADQSKWTYRKVPKVEALRSFAGLPFWCRKPQKMTYHLCAKDLTKSTIVPNLPEEERRALMEHGTLPLESSAKDRILCGVSTQERFTKTSTMLLMLQVVPHWLQLPDTPRQSLPLPCPDLGSEEEDHCTKAPIS